MGEGGTGILKLLTFGGLTTWAPIDIILIALTKLDDREGLPLVGVQRRALRIHTNCSRALARKSVTNASQTSEDIATTASTARATLTPVHTQRMTEFLPGGEAVTADPIPAR